MKFTEATYTKRFNLGDYQHAEYSVSAEIEKSEDPVLALAILKEAVEKAHGSAAVGREVVEDIKAADEEVPPPAPVKKKKEKKAKKEVVEEEPEEVEPKKKSKKKGTVYMRSNETHKLLFAEKLTELFPKWKKDEKSKSKAKQVSLDLDGEEFLDAEGVILESFIEKLEEGMA